MSREPILRPGQADYLRSLLPPRDALLREMEEHAREHDVPISRPETARLLEILARATGARAILEIGTAIGYGAVCLARGAPAARVLTLERDAQMATRARDYLGRARLLERVDVLLGDALEILPTLEGPFDLVYLDGDKEQYRRYLDLTLPRLALGGTVVADNLLWSGRIAEPPAEPDASARALEAFNGYLVMHPQLAASVLPVGDGVGIAVKTQRLVTEMGGPF